jgi:hypothetical protein
MRAIAVSSALMLHRSGARRKPREPTRARDPRLALLAAIAAGGAVAVAPICQSTRGSLRATRRSSSRSSAAWRIVERARGVAAARRLGCGRAVRWARRRGGRGRVRPDGDAPMRRDTRFLGQHRQSFHAAPRRLARARRTRSDAPIARWIGGEKWFARLPNARAAHAAASAPPERASDHLYSLEFIASG